MLSLLLIILVLICTIFVCLLLFRRYRHRQKPIFHSGSDDLSVCIVLGSGGHTSEILHLIGALDANIYRRRQYIYADSDNMSRAKAEAFEAKTSTSSAVMVAIPRSREVRQRLMTTAIMSIRSLFASLPVVAAFNADLLLCNGPGTCIPICIWTYLFDLCRLRSTRIVFVESVCRVRRLSLTGLILYHLDMADRIIVQWPQLVHKYPSTIYIGRI